MTHKDLDIWKKSIEFVTSSYNVTKEYPREELFRLVSQMRNAAVSIPSNVAEGTCRKGKTEFKHFLYISLVSGAELETQIIISGNLDYTQKKNQTKILEELNTISSMIQGLIKSIN